MKNGMASVARGQATGDAVGPLHDLVDLCLHTLCIDQELLRLLVRPGGLFLELDELDLELSCIAVIHRNPIDYREVMTTGVGAGRLLGVAGSEQRGLRPGRSDGRGLATAAQSGRGR